MAVSGSVALLGDTLRNAADALTAAPLGVAFVVGRRPPARRYTCAPHRAGIRPLGAAPAVRSPPVAARLSAVLAEAEPQGRVGGRRRLPAPLDE